MILKDIDMGTW